MFRVIDYPTTQIKNVRVVVQKISMFTGARLVLSNYSQVHGQNKKIIITIP